jgi:hypothetical protein
VLEVELANLESRSSWREFLLGLREHGLSGVEFVVSEDHAGLKQAIVEVLPEAAWQGCSVGLLKKVGSCDPLFPDTVAGGEGLSRCWVERSAGSRSSSLPDRFVTCCRTTKSWSGSIGFSISAGCLRRSPSSRMPRPGGRASIPRLLSVSCSRGSCSASSTIGG